VIVMLQSPSAAVTKLLDFIASFEAPQGYDTVFGNNQKFLPQKLTSMTLDEVLAAQVHWTQRFGSSAAGRYQFMRNTLLGLQSEMGLSGALLFDAGLQDSLGLRLLKRRGYEQFVARILPLNAFGLNLAKEWASLPVLQAVQGQRRPVVRGQSFYADDGLNRSLVAPERVEAMLNQVLALARQPTTPIAKPESPMVDHPPAGPAPVLENNMEPKPWYLSKGVVGGAIAVAIPVLSLFVPALRVVDPVTATDWVMKAIQVGGPAIGGALAILGRIQATQPIAGTAAAATVQKAIAAGQGTSVADSASRGIWNLPLLQVIDELPAILESLKQLGVLAGVAAPPIADNFDSAPASGVFPPSKEPPPLALEANAIGALTKIDIEKMLSPIQRTLSDIQTALASGKPSVQGAPAAMAQPATNAGAAAPVAEAKSVAQLTVADIENVLSPIEQRLADIKSEVTTNRQVDNGVTGLVNAQEEQASTPSHSGPTH
jgi:muramidase (phage lysozyme)